MYLETMYSYGVYSLQKYRQDLPFPDSCAVGIAAHFSLGSLPCHVIFYFESRLTVYSASNNNHPVPETLNNLVARARTRYLGPVLISIY